MSCCIRAVLGMPDLAARIRGNMSRKILKQELRRLAALSKQKKGFEIEDVGGRGIGAGVRLRARKGLIRREIAVRTSDDRKVGLTRTPDGKWRTVSEVDEVLV